MEILRCCSSSKPRPTEPRSHPHHLNQPRARTHASHLTARSVLSCGGRPTQCLLPLPPALPVRACDRIASDARRVRGVVCTCGAASSDRRWAAEERQYGPNSRQAGPRRPPIDRPTIDRVKRVSINTDRLSRSNGPRKGPRVSRPSSEGKHPLGASQTGEPSPPQPKLDSRRV